MHKEVVTKTVYISYSGKEFDTELECLKDEIRYELFAHGWVDDSYGATEALDYILRNIDTLNRIVELDKSEVAEAF